MSFYVKEYNRKANEIISNAIKSALYIDENALEPFEPETGSDLEDVQHTQKLSKDLYWLFHKNYVSLAIHKFKDVESTIPYLDSKDLILLDWHLDGRTSGEEFALDILEEIVKYEHIHFCCIYTNHIEDDVLANCISYFSGYNRKLCEAVLDEFDGDDEFIDEIEPYLKKILALPNLMNESEILKYKSILQLKNRELVSKIGKASCFSNEMNFAKKLKSLALAFSELKKSNSENTPVIKIIDLEKKICSINNTIICVIRKNHETDKKKLVNKIREHLLLEKNSFLMMLGIEMQNIIKSSSAFISSNLADFEDKTLAYHWKQNISNNHEGYFYDLMNNVMISQIENNCLNKRFELLDSGMLHNKIACPDSRELCKLNTFYNGTIFLNDRNIRFGDIFYGKNGDYFLCITPLCDCFQPENISNKYFFVKGRKHPSVDKALKLGEQAFLSFIDHDTCIIWTSFGQDTGREENKYLPIYIKPFQLYIPNSKIKNSKVFYLTCNQVNEEVAKNELEYKFSLRQQYAQRIANYAFSHSVRVGIDFAKIK